jgi:phosphate transport system permease protein
MAVTDLEAPAIDGAPSQRTVLPGDHPPAAPAVARVLGKWSKDDSMLLAGVVMSSLATTALLFGRLTPLSGRLGFVVVFFLIFLVTYAVMTSFTESGPSVVDRVMTALLTSAAMVAMFALGSVIVYVLYRSFDALINPNFYIQDLSQAGPLTPLTEGGMLHAIAGTLIMTFLSLIFTVPLAVTCAVFLNESGSRSASFVRTVVTAMTALPSIVAGLFIFATFILVVGFERSGLAASLAISLMMLPIIIRASDVVLRLVPGSLREASSALGAPKWRTVWHVVLPTARSGLTTSVILGVARGIGETAPILLTAGYTSTMNLNPRSNAMVSLPLAAFELVRSSSRDQIARGFGAAALLMILVLILFSIARLLGGRPAGHLSKRQRRKRAQQSIDDLARIERQRNLREQGLSPMSSPQHAPAGAPNRR